MTAASEREIAAGDWVARADAVGCSMSAAPSEVIAAFMQNDDEFTTWIDQSFENRTAFLRALGAWQRANRLAALAPGVEVKRRAWWSPRRTVWIASAMAACIGLVVVASVVLNATRTHALEFETAIGGRESVPLADGSQLQLNTNTKLSATINDTQRFVALEKGEAFFEVSHDPERPFVVDSGDQRITVLGTKFSVSRTSKGVEVIVAEGRVRIDAHDSATSAIAERGVVVMAQGADFDVAQKTAEEVEAALAWREGRLFFDQMTLAEVAAEFNRYNQVKIEIGDAVAGGIPIGGSFEANNVEAFARLMRDGFGLSVVQRGEKIIIKS